MMEKYGTDFKELPVTDDQIRTLNKMASSYEMPKNRDEADKLIEKIASEKDS